MAALFVADVPFFALADGTLHRWDGGPKVTSTHNGLLAATPTGDRSAILTGGEDGRVCRTGKCGTSVELASVPRKWITTGASGYAGAFAFGSGRTVWLHEGAGAMRVLQHPSAVEDIAFAPDGILYVLQISKNGIPVFNPGALIQILPDGTRTEIVPGQLRSPGGIAIGEDGALYVTNRSVQPLTGEVYRIDL